MTTITLDELMTFARQELVGVPEPVVEDAVKVAVREFAVATEQYIDKNTISTVAGTADYTLTPTDITTESHRIIGMNAADAAGATWRLRPGLRNAELTNPYNDANHESSPREYWMNSSSQFGLYPIPDDIYTISVWFSVKPLDTATVFDSGYTEWKDAIAAYAKYWCLRMVGQSWANAQAAVANLTLYRHYVGRARALMNTSRGGAPARVQMRPFA